MGWSDSELATEETVASDRFLRRRGEQDSRPAVERPASMDDLDVRPTVTPDGLSRPLEEGTYDRESVADILEELRHQRSVIQDEPAGFIEWEERTIPVVPESEAEFDQDEPLIIQPTPIPEDPSNGDDLDSSSAADESRRFWRSRRNQSEPIVEEETEPAPSPTSRAQLPSDLSSPVPR